ncbi:MAG: hypothetical protein ACTSVM_03990 [Candidatus Ranarchaeia archaeon]
METFVKHESAFIPLIVLLSGEAPTLPAAECLAALKSCGQPVNIVSQQGRLLRIMSTSLAPTCIRRRCAYTHLVIHEVFQSSLSLKSIVSHVRRSPFFSLLPLNACFAVRVKAIDGAVPFLPVPLLERKIGQVIADRFRNKVNLRRPDVLFYGIITGSRFYFGVLAARTSRSTIARNRPSSRPFFKPSSMDPLLARSLANLVHAAPGLLVLDPFCGTGGLLLEAYSLGAKIIAVELDTKTVVGAKRNLMGRGHVVRGDARYLPFRVVHAILTDPPYGRAASTKGVSLPNLVGTFLEDASRLLSKGGLICISVPDSLPLEDVASSTRLRCVEKHAYFVHRSLTRRIYVLEALPREAETHGVKTKI